MDTIIQYFDLSGWPGLLVSSIAVALIAYLIVTPIIFYVLQKLISKTKTDLDDKLFAIVKPPVFWTIFLLSEKVLIELAEVIEPKLASVLLSVLLSILILVWAPPLIKASKVLLEFISKKQKGFFNRATLPLFKNISVILILSFAVYFLFMVWGISLTAWLASAGVVGIAVGFAAKDTLSNLISGIFILADAPYKVGDVIVLDSGEKGEVIHVGLRSTRIRTFDGVEVTVPNAVIANSKIFNETGTHIDKKIRIKIPVGICYDCDIEQAEKIMLEIAHSQEEILEDPKPKVMFMNFGASSLDLELRFWIPDISYRAVADKVRRRILEEFKRANIEIPYQKIDVNLFNQN